MIEPGRYTSGRIAVANLSASIEALEHRRVEGASFEDLFALSKLLFLRGDLLGRIADHDRAERIAAEAVGVSPDVAKRALHPGPPRGAIPPLRRGGRAARSCASPPGIPDREVDAERAGLLQATGRYPEALALRERMAKEDPGMHTLGALASLLAEMDRWAAAETHVCGRARCGCRRVALARAANCSSSGA